jgi:hypothetical protein
MLQQVPGAFPNGAGLVTRRHRVDHGQYAPDENIPVVVGNMPPRHGINSGGITLVMADVFTDTSTAAEITGVPLINYFGIASLSFGSGFGPLQ